MRPLIVIAAVFVILAVFVAGVFYGQPAVAATTDPGSDADPVVTKSYVDQFAGLTVIQIKAGQTLTAEGGAEIILRSGQATVVETTNGLADVTQGKDLTRGTTVPLNHLLIVPRSDGRGIKALTDGFVMVRGVFTVK